MIKVTVANVTRMSEDALFLALADLSDSDPMTTVIEAELDRRTDLEQSNLKRRQALQLESLKLTQAIQSEIQEIFAGFKGKKTLVLIENLGQEFIEEYYVDETTLTVYSKAQQVFPNQPSTWECETMDMARGKMAKLIYYRIYDKFMRDATRDNLQLLKRVLGG